MRHKSSPSRITARTDSCRVGILVAARDTNLRGEFDFSTSVASFPGLQRVESQTKSTSSGYSGMLRTESSSWRIRGGKRYAPGAVLSAFRDFCLPEPNHLNYHLVSHHASIPIVQPFMLASIPSVEEISRGIVEGGRATKRSDNRLLILNSARLGVILRRRYLPAGMASQYYDRPERS